MTFDRQNIVALLVVALAAAYVLRGLWRVWRSVRGGAESTCGGCGSCSQAAGPKQFVEIDLRRPE